jgi:post-segregation antitoxin (ccd killing protein)
MDMVETLPPPVEMAQMVRVEISAVVMAEMEAEMEDMAEMEAHREAAVAAVNRLADKETGAMEL